jgi:hypothetical protein
VSANCGGDAGWVGVAVATAWCRGTMGSGTLLLFAGTICAGRTPVGVTVCTRGEAVGVGGGMVAVGVVTLFDTLLGGVAVC